MSRCRDSIVVPVLGMQHSGTETVAHLLSQLGVGFYSLANQSSSDGDCFRNFNTELLRMTGCDVSGFDAPQKLSASSRFCGQATLDEFRVREVSNFLETMFPTGPWGWDDPRTVITLDFWLRLLKELGFTNVRPIVVVRHPAEVSRIMTADVAKSTGGQLPMDRLHCMAADLWLAYHRILWRYCCRYQWAIVTFDSLNRATGCSDEVARLAGCIGLDASRMAAATKKLDWRSAIQIGQLSAAQLNLPPETTQLYEQFKRLATPKRTHLTETAMDRDEARLVHKAQALKELGRIDAAVELLSKALSIRPQYRAARFVLSYTLMETGHISKSFEHSEWLIRSEPDDPVGHGLQAFGLTQQARIDEAIISFHECLRLRPENSVAWSNLLFSSLYSDSLSAQEVKDLHVKGSNAIADRSNSPLKTGSLAPISRAKDIASRPLRIGYLSADLKKHPVGYFLRSLLQNHDRNKFQTYCYHTSPAQDDLTAILKKECQQWRDVHSLDDSLLTEKIRSDRIDVLIDLSGHSSGNRSGVIINRAAPVQAMYLGYPATSGLPNMDFNISDGYLSPREFEHLYSERLARLDNCFLCFHPHDAAPAVSKAPCEANGFVTFGSFNNLPKVSSSTIQLWSDLLNSVPGSRLVIKALSLVDAGTRELFYQHFCKKGIDRSRVDLLPPTIPLSKFLDEYRRIDIGLDPIPYNGGTTTCEALWMGVPVITLPGSSFCSRMGLSILRTLGQSDWVAESREDYIRIAGELAAQPLLIAQHRRELRDRMLNSPLCDGRKFTEGFENCCRWMVEQLK